MPGNHVDAAHFSPDTQDFIRLLHRYSAHYIIVGGEAVIYYGSARLTGDVDFFYDARAPTLSGFSRRYSPSGAATFQAC